MDILKLNLQQTEPQAPDASVELSRRRAEVFPGHGQGRFGRGRRVRAWAGDGRRPSDRTGSAVTDLDVAVLVFALV